jgi:hypothetical protein
VSRAFAFAEFEVTCRPRNGWWHRFRKQTERFVLITEVLNHQGRR